MQAYTHSEQFMAYLKELREVNQDIVILEEDKKDGKVSQDTYIEIGTQLAHRSSEMMFCRDSLGW